MICKYLSIYFQMNTLQRQSICKYSLIFNCLGQEHVYHCVTLPFLLTTPNKQLLKLCRWNYFPFLLDVQLQLLNSLWSPLSYIVFYNVAHISRQVWTSSFPTLSCGEALVIPNHDTCGMFQRGFF